jgi:hypothetical protein
MRSCSVLVSSATGFVLRCGQALASSAAGLSCAVAKKFHRRLVCPALWLYVKIEGRKFHRRLDLPALWLHMFFVCTTHTPLYIVSYIYIHKRQRDSYQKSDPPCPGKVFVPKPTSPSCEVNFLQVPKRHVLPRTSSLDKNNKGERNS